ncbi:MAG: transcription termination/antitermination protein NusG [Bacteroidota bacterium]|jgi:transcriptional antiterminator NusG|nr:transcription termination/antitermination protein NusG [Saprospiraceae bacterium]
MSNEKLATTATAGEERKWYSLRVISGKEKKIQERIVREIELNGWEPFIFSVIVPTEKVYKVRNGKKVMQERNLLPGYILVEAIGSKLNGDVAKLIADIPNVIHFLGKEVPIPMTNPEANRLLGKVDESSESGETLSEPFLINETIKIIDGPFAEFIGDIQEVNDEKKKLKVIVKIFGRGTEVELNFLQVEKIS